MRSRHVESDASTHVQGLNMLRVLWQIWRDRKYSEIIGFRDLVVSKLLPQRLIFLDLVWLNCVALLSLPDIFTFDQYGWYRSPETDFVSQIWGCSCR